MKLQREQSEALYHGFVLLLTPGAAESRTTEANELFVDIHAKHVAFQGKLDDASTYAMKQGDDQALQILLQFGAEVKRTDNGKRKLLAMYADAVKYQGLDPAIPIQLLTIKVRQDEVVAPSWNAMPSAMASSEGVDI